jgi:hypothetical protein
MVVHALTGVANVRDLDVSMIENFDVDRRGPTLTGQSSTRSPREPVLLDGVIYHDPIGNDPVVHPGDDPVVSWVYLVAVECLGCLEIRDEYEWPVRGHESEVVVDLDRDDAGHDVDQRFQTRLHLGRVAPASVVVIGRELEGDNVANHGSSGGPFARKSSAFRTASVVRNAPDAVGRIP